MYTKKETILLNIFLNRIVRKHFDFTFLYRKKIVFTPMMVGCDKTYVRGNYLIRVVIVFPYSEYLTTQCKNHIIDVVYNLGYQYGILLKCFTYTVKEESWEHEIAHFKAKFDNVVTSPENVK